MVEIIASLPEIGIVDVEIKLLDWLPVVVWEIAAAFDEVVSEIIGSEVVDIFNKVAVELVDANDSTSFMSKIEGSNWLDDKSGMELLELGIDTDWLVSSCSSKDPRNCYDKKNQIHVKWVITKDHIQGVSFLIAVYVPI